MNYVNLEIEEKFGISEITYWNTNSGIFRICMVFQVSPEEKTPVLTVPEFLCSV